MTHEVLLCRFLQSLVHKETGESAIALGELEQLVRDLREHGEVELLASALAPLAELLSIDGQMDKAMETLAEAAISARARGDRLAEATIYVSLAECHVLRGNQSEAIRWGEAAVSKASASGSIATLAYYRVWLADVLLRSGLVEEAKRQVALASPVLKAEQMVPEAVHAAKLMSEINSRSWPSPTDSIKRERS
ncbi:MAG: tetratricopeptide repeat protein [Acidobacteria bacterium]|nr:tetratricopeptide repeat protein [Acidobacteriota bacterium]